MGGEGRVGTYSSLSSYWKNAILIDLTCLAGTNSMSRNTYDTREDKRFGYELKGSMTNVSNCRKSPLPNTFLQDFTVKRTNHIIYEHSQHNHFEL